MSRPATDLRSSRLGVSADELYRWHARPGAFERLTPPWEPVRVGARDSRLALGARTHRRIGRGPFRLSWLAEHRAVDPGRGFTDVPLRGAFARWQHRHEFRPDGPDAAILEDRILFAPPLGPRRRSLGSREGLRRPRRAGEPGRGRAPRRGEDRRPPLERGAQAGSWKAAQGEPAFSVRRWRGSRDLGHPRQQMSWIALEDLLYAIAWILGRPEIEGRVNACAPPVTNAEFTRALARALRRPAKLVASGFAFRHPAIDDALRHALGRETS